ELARHRGQDRRLDGAPCGEKIAAFLDRWAGNDRATVRAQRDKPVIGQSREHLAYYVAVRAEHVGERDFLEFRARLQPMVEHRRVNTLVDLVLVDAGRRWLAHNGRPSPQGRG